ncbi:MAG: antitoxin family protein [Nostocaceae cyanobacterium]|nr:antitoxin family protein [Nostocaceae cyanobacterium]
MPEIITAVYENGVLRPLTPLLLQEHQTVQIQVILTSPPPNGKIAPISKLERQELATPFPL